MDGDIVKNYSVSIENVCESLFLEIKIAKQKRIIIGCIYRHHTPIEDFCKEYWTSTFQKIAKSNIIST